MRRALVTALAVPFLLLSACGGDDPGADTTTPDEIAEETQPPAMDETESTDDASDTEATTDAPETDDAASTDDAVSTEDGDGATAIGADDASTTTGAPDDGEATDDAGESAAGPEGGAEGQAVADRTKEWLVALIEGEDAVCDMMLDLESEGPMVDNESHYEVCLATLPTLGAEQFTEEQAGILTMVEITGADVQGDTAVVDKDNFSELFAEGIGDQVITLQRIDGEWYVDMNKSFN